METAVFVRNLALLGLIGSLPACNGCWPIDNCAIGEKSHQYWDMVHATDAMDPTPLEDVPTDGVATYSGGARMNFYEDGEYLTFMDSDFTLTAEFLTGTAYGELSDFQSLESAVPGALVISGGSIIGNEVFADVDGALGPEGLEATDYRIITVDGSLVAIFVGPSADGVIADISGDVSYEGGGSGTIDGDARAVVE